MSDFLLIEGFDAYNGVAAANGGLESKWVISGGGIYNLAAGRFGGQCLRLADSSGSTRAANRFLSAFHGPDFCVGFAYRHPDTTVIGTQAIFSLRSGASEQIMIYQLGNTLQIRRGGTVLFTSLPIIVSGQWHYIELFGNLADAGGHVEFWFDNVKINEFNGDTNNVAGAQYNNVVLFAPDASGSGFLAAFDDFYLFDDDIRLGEMRIDYAPVNGDTADKDFVPSTGAANSVLLDEVPASATDYVTGSVVGDKDIYDLANLTDDGGQIFAVQTLIGALKTDAGAREMNVITVSGASTVTKAAVLTTVPYLHEGDILDLNPSSSSLWTFTALNALKVGQEVTV